MMNLGMHSFYNEEKCVPCQHVSSVDLSLPPPCQFLTSLSVFGMAAALQPPQFACPHIPVAPEHSTARGMARSGEVGRGRAFFCLWAAGDGAHAHGVGFLATHHALHTELAPRQPVQDPQARPCLICPPLPPVCHKLLLVGCPVGLGLRVCVSVLISRRGGSAQGLGLPKPEAPE